MGIFVISFKICDNISLLDRKYRRQIHVGVERIEGVKTFIGGLWKRENDKLEQIPKGKGERRGTGMVR